MEYETEYAESNPSWHLEDANDKAADVLNAMKRSNLTPTSMCDIGCGAGAVLASVHNAMGVERSVGYDLSGHAISMAQHRVELGLSFTHGNAAEEPGSFDLMLILDVVEHVPDPVAFMQSVRHKAPLVLLNIPLELSAIKVLSAESLVRGRRALGHIHYFNEALALEMLSEAGYAVRDAWISPPGLGRPEKGRRRILRSLQRAATTVSPRWASRTVGGCSLVVVAASIPPS